MRIEPVQQIPDEFIQISEIHVADADLEVEENAINKCLQILEENKNIGIVAPRMYDSENQPIRRSSWKIRTFGLDVIHSTRLLEFIF